MVPIRYQHRLHPDSTKHRRNPGIPAQPRRARSRTRWLQPASNGRERDNPGSNNIRQLGRLGRDPRHEQPPQIPEWNEYPLARDQTELHERQRRRGLHHAMSHCPGLNHNLQMAGCAVRFIVVPFAHWAASVGRCFWRDCDQRPCYSEL